MFLPSKMTKNPSGLGTEPPWFVALTILLVVILVVLALR